MLPIEVHNVGADALMPALVGAAMALIVAVLGGVFTYVATVRKTGADLKAATRAAQAVLAAAEETARATVHAARVQAAAAREAGLQNAIDTEAMKLRFRMVERHLDRFHERAGAFVALLTELERNEEVAARFVNSMPHTPTVVLMEAELVGRPEDWEQLAAVQLAFREACTSVHHVLHDNPDRERWTSDTYAELTKSWFTAVTALQHITSVVNVSSVLRAQGAPGEDPSGLLSVLWQRWEEKKTLLKRGGLWGGRFVSES